MASPPSHSLKRIRFRVWSFGDENILHVMRKFSRSKLGLKTILRFKRHFFDDMRIIIKPEYYTVFATEYIYQYNNNNRFPSWTQTKLNWRYPRNSSGIQIILV